MIVAVVLIVLALVYYLLSTIVALRKITAGLDEVIADVTGIVEKSAPVNDDRDRDQRAARRGRRPARGPARQEGRPDRRGRARRRPLPGSRRGRVPELPRAARRSTAPRIGEVYTKGTLTLARLGREAPIAAASPNGPVLRNVEGGSLAARAALPRQRQTAPQKLPALARDRHRRPGPVRAARRHRRASQAAPHPHA